MQNIEELERNYTSAVETVKKAENYKNACLARMYGAVGNPSALDTARRSVDDAERDLEKKEKELREITSQLNGLRTDKLFQDGLKLYQNGQNGAAAPYFIKAADDGHSDAKFYLAGMHQRKQFDGADPKKAIQLYEILAENNPQCMFELGKMYCRGDIGFPDDNGKYGNPWEWQPEEGFRLLEKVKDIVGDMNQLPATDIETLGDIYCTGRTQRHKDPINDISLEELLESIKYFQMALDKRDAGDTSSKWPRSQLEQQMAYQRERLELVEEKLLEKQREREQQEAIAKEKLYLQLLEDKKRAEAKPNLVLEDFNILCNWLYDMNYKDSAILFEECDKIRQSLIEEQKRQEAIARENIYMQLLEAKGQAEAKTDFNVQEFRTLADKFRNMNRYKDTFALSQNCSAEAATRQSKLWESQGLCRYCGHKLGLFKKCKNKERCGKKQP
jgi:TPR repeat protein